MQYYQYPPHHHVTGRTGGWWVLSSSPIFTSMYLYYQLLTLPHNENLWMMALLLLIQIKVLHILPEIGMVVNKSFTNSLFSYQRSLKLPVKSSLTSITVLASSLLIQMLCISKYSVMSKFKNPSRLSRRLGCWDNPSGYKTPKCTQWGMNGKWRSVMFLIFSGNKDWVLPGWLSINMNMVHYLY